MRLVCDDYLLKTASMGSPGVDNIRWKLPVRPGDTISAVFTVLQKRETRAPDRGVVTLQIDVLNQHGEIAQIGTAKMLIRRSGTSPRVDVS